MGIKPIRSLLVLLLLLGLTRIPGAHAATFQGEVSLLYRMWDEVDLLSAKERQRAPLYGYLNLRTNDIGTRGLNLVISGLGALETGDDYPVAKEGGYKDGNVFAAYLEWSDTKGCALLRGGRQSLFSGLRQIYIDGGRARVGVIPKHVTLDVYGGEWRDLHAGGIERDPGPAYGADAIFDVDSLSFSAGYHVRGKDDEKIERVCSRFSYYAPGYFKVAADGEYDAKDSKVVRYDGTFAVPIGARVSWLIEARRYDPTPDADQEEDLFRLFIAGFSDHYGTGLAYTSREGHELFVRASYQSFELLKGVTDHGSLVEAGGRADFMAASGYSLELTLSDLNGYRGRMYEASGGVHARVLLPELTVGLMADYIRYQEIFEDWEHAYTITGSVDYVYADYLTIGIRLEESTDPDYKSNFRPGIKIGMKW